jgi:aminoglycoside phosphotransferase (APT) family kinase protein
MYSKSKTNIDQHTAQAIVSEAFGDEAQLAGFEELADGYFNAAYLLELRDGRRGVLKIAPPPDVPILRYERGIMRSEVETLRRVRSQTTVRAPEVLWYDSSHRIVPSDWFLMSFVPGIPFNRAREQLSPAAIAQVERTVGDSLRQMHAVEGDGFGYMALPEQRHITWRQAFLAMMGDLLGDGEALGVTLPVPYAELRANIHAAAGTLDEVVTPRLLHWDLWDGNIFVDTTHGEVTGLIDFERALWGDPLMEFQFRTFATTPAFDAGYGSALLTTPEERRRRTLYNLYLYLIMIVECYVRHYATDDQEQWARARLEEELRRLVTGDR